MLTLPPPPPPSSMSLPTNATKSVRQEIKRDSAGVSEKLRRHGGNIPVLPQTKQCPQCPARFTRSTHLNRHLKTHSAERMHKCEQCASEFTRTDLLSRHKKTCNGVSRSRRKSCAPCAESKIKCDLAFPCDKCASRGKECVAAAPKRPRRATASQVSTAASSSSTDVSPPTFALGPSPGAAHEMSVPPLSAPDHASVSPRSDTIATPAASVHNWRSQYATSVSGVSQSRDGASTYQSGTVAPQLSSMYQSTMFDPLFNGLFNPSGANAQPAQQGYTWLAPTTQTSMQHSSPLTTQPPTNQPYQAPHVTPKEHRGPQLQDIMFSFAEYNQTMPQQQPSPPEAQQSYSPGAAQEQPRTAAVYQQYTPPQSQLYVDGFTVYGYAPDEVRHELNDYMHLFWTQFTPQMPIMHAPTWNPEGKPDYLIAAMRAAGALYVRTRRAGQFIGNTLMAARRRLNVEFAKPVPDTQSQSWLFLSVALLQAVGMFHQNQDTRASHLSFQAMLVQMIRRYGIVGHNASWRQIKHHDAASLQAAWFDWAEHEVTKRAIMLSLVHDCCHLIFFGIPALFSASEFDLNLPTDCDIWSAATADEWWATQHRPSVYGWPELRVHGYPMQKALQALADSRRLDSLTAKARINPLAHWVLIHAVLRNLFALAPDVAHADRGGFYPAWGAAGAGTVSASSTSYNAPGTDEDALRVQYVLHNWLESWLRTPESQEWRDGRELPFMCDALPFYWLGQVSLLALQEGVPPFTPGSRLTPDGRFRLVKHWLRHVRAFLRRGSHEPTVLWNEMMKIRLQGIDADGRTPDDEDGLLGFFD